MPAWSAEELLAQRAWLRALAERLVRDEAERDDLVQEAWLAALRLPRSGAGDLRSWLGGVVRNRWRFERRTEERRSARELSTGGAESSLSAAELAEQAELQRVLVGAVLSLEEPYRSTVLLRYFGALSSRAIARREGVPDGTVRSWLKRALDQLRDELDRSHGGERERWALALVPLARDGATTWTAAGAGLALLLVVAASGWVIAARVRGDGREVRRAVETAVLASTLPDEGAEPETEREPEVPPIEAIEAPSGRGPGRQAVEPASAGAAEGGNTLVRVLDPEGAPIPGASVTWWLGEEKRTERTDHEGRAVLPIESEHGLELCVEAPGFFPDQAKRGGDGLTVHLLRATALVGRVLDAPSGMPIAEARVSSVGFEARSDPSGSFRIEGVPVGEEFWIEGEAPGHPLQGRLLLLRSVDPEPLELWLDRGLELRGRVLDLLTGEPIAGALLTDAGLGRELVRCGPEGAFDTRVSSSPDGFTDLLVSAPGYCGVRLEFRGAGDDGLVLPLVRTTAIEGLVRDQLGRPVSGARVWLRGRSELRVSEVEDRFEPDSPFRALPASWRLTWGDPRAKSDEEGRFRLEGAPPWGTKVEVWADIGPETSAGKALIEHMPAPGESVFVELSMKVPVDSDTVPGRITGTLRINGSPFSGRMIWENGASRGEASAEHDGTFTLEDVAPGEVVLRAGRRYGAGLWSPSAEAQRKTVEVVAGATAHADFDLEIEMASIRGRVRLPSREPARGQGVFCRSIDDPMMSLTAETDEAGAYELRVPAGSGSYDVYSRHGPDTVARRVVPAGAEGIDLDLLPFGSVRLRARDESTGRALEALWFCRRAGDEWRELGDRGLAPDTEGFAEAELLTGPWELACGAPESGYPFRLLPLAIVAEGEPSLVDFALEAVSSLELVLEPDGPLPWRLTQLVAEDEAAFAPLGALEIWLRRRIEFDGGRALVRGLIPGAYGLTSLDGRIRFEPSSVLVGDGAAGPVSVRWSETDRR